MNHGPQDGNNVHFLSRQTISQEIWPTPPPPPPPPPISICMEAARLSPEVARGQREVLPFKRRHLSRPAFSILKEAKGGGWGGASVASSAPQGLIWISYVPPPPSG